MAERLGADAVAAHHGSLAKELRLDAITSGGIITDSGDYAVLLEPQGLTVGSLNEDFAIESMAGDVCQLGNQSYRILRVEPGKVRGEDAQGQAPTIPCWLGEAPGRSDELSAGVARLREQVEQVEQVLSGSRELLGDEGGVEPFADRSPPTSESRAGSCGSGWAALHLGCENPPVTTPSPIENASTWLMQSIGLANADSFAGLRSQLLPAAKRSQQQRRARRGLANMQDARLWTLLREVRKRPSDGSLVSLSACEPLSNKLSALAGNRLLYRDDVPVACLVAGKIQLLQEADPFTAGQWQAALIRQPNTPTPLVHGPYRT